VARVRTYIRAAVENYVARTDTSQRSLVDVILLLDECFR
jgi:hypothetical protein